MLAIVDQEERMAWQYDASLCKVEWAVEYLGIATVKGLFKTVHATLSLEDPDPRNWSAEVTIETASLTSGHPPMEEHVRSPDFLDVERYPTATFTSRRVEPVAPSKGHATGHYRLVGELTLRGVTREVVLDGMYGGEATDSRGRTRRGFSAQTTLKRSDFGIPSGMAGERLVAGEHVRVTLEIIATKAE
jgi:polyisoprenoid-binding protein YceI